MFGGEGIEFAGGAEVQQALVGRGLAALGFDVHVATCDYGQPDGLVVDGITFHRTFRAFAGLPGLRFFHPRLTRTVAALRAADAEVYYVRGSGFPAGITHDVARSRRAAFVLGAASNHDLEARMALVTNVRDRWWYRRALLGAEAVIAQTDFQQRLFADEFGRPSEVIPNLVELPAAALDAGREGAVLWLATYRPSKRTEWFVELARRLPGRRFVMCGVIPIPPETTAAWDAARRAAEELPNLEVRGFVDHSRLGELFAAGCLFVHTSPAEGFPNTVLEAWAHGLPSVTAVDPDGVVAREGVGEVVGDFESLLGAVSRLLDDAPARRAMGARARAYVARRHAPDAVLERYGSLLDRTVAKVRARRLRG
jgi:glycosyltransferase involved in cell wall biosynthesis